MLTRSEAAPYRERMAKKKRASTAAVPISHALIGIARDLELRMLTRLGDEGGHSGLRPSLGPFLSLVWLEAPTNPALEIVDLPAVIEAAHACSRLARVALTAGYLARRSGSTSLRGQLVELSPRGRLLVEDAIGIIRETGADYESRVGSNRFDRLAESVAALYRVLEVQPACINVKGKTHEKVDAIGQGLAMEVHVVALLMRRDAADA